MADNYDRFDNEGGGGFVMGLITGAVLGAGIGMLLAPKAGADLRGQIGEQARNLGNMASEQYRKATEQAGGWAEKGREFATQAKDVVSRGVDEARGYAGAATGSTFGNTGSSTFGNTGNTGGGDFGRS